MFGSKEKPAAEEGGAEGAEEEVEMAEKGKKGDVNDKSVGEMKRGDYMIHVYLEKAKDLKCPEDGTVDPMVEILCLG